MTGNAGAAACMGQLLSARLGKSRSFGSRQVCLTAPALAGTAQADTAQADTDLRWYGTARDASLCTRGALLYCEEI